MAETLSAKEAALELGTNARTFRKFMRAITPKEDQPGQGNRYAIEADDMKKLKQQFEEWNAPKAKTTSKNGSTPDEVEEIEDDELLSIDDSDEEVDLDEDDEVALADLDFDEDELEDDDDPDLEEDIEEL